MRASNFKLDSSEIIILFNFSDRQRSIEPLTFEFLLLLSTVIISLTVLLKKNTSLRYDYFELCTDRRYAGGTSVKDDE